MKAVDRFLKARAHLDLIDQYKVVLSLCISILNVVMQSVILCQTLELVQVEIDMNDIGVWVAFAHIRHKGIEQLGLSAASNAGDYFDIGRTHNVLQFVQIKISFDQSHRASPRALLYPFYFAKSR